MKTKDVWTAAAAAAVMISGSAMATGYDPALDVTYDLSDFSLVSEANGGGPVVFEFDIAANENLIVGFSFSGLYDEDPTPSASWASDTRMLIDINGVDTYDIGGFTGVVNDWSFQGGDSTDPGAYAETANLIWKDTPIDKSGGGTLTLTFTNDWNSTSAADLLWSGGTFTLHKVPAPGALALLGIAGLAGSRRRRG